MTIRVVLAEDNLLAREGLRALLGGADGIELVAVCVDYDELVAAVDEHRPDVVLTDIRMPPRRPRACGRPDQPGIRRPDRPATLDHPGRNS